MINWLTLFWHFICFVVISSNKLLKHMSRTSIFIINKVGDMGSLYFNTLNNLKIPKESPFVKIECHLLLINLTTMSIIFLKNNFWWIVLETFMILYHMPFPYLTSLLHYAIYPFYWYLWIFLMPIEYFQQCFFLLQNLWIGNNSK